jgi:hypothetical protein
LRTCHALDFIEITTNPETVAFRHSTQSGSWHLWEKNGILKYQQRFTIRRLTRKMFTQTYQAIIRYLEMIGHTGSVMAHAT